jgi:hypothetical protein
VCSVSVLDWQIKFTDESIAKFHNTFGADALAAIDFYKKEFCLKSHNWQLE